MIVCHCSRFDVRTSFDVSGDEVPEARRQPRFDQSGVRQLLVKFLANFLCNPFGRLAVQTQPGLSPVHQLLNMMGNRRRVRFVDTTQANCFSLSVVVDESDTITLPVFLYACHIARFLSC